MVKLVKDGDAYTVKKSGFLEYLSSSPKLEVIFIFFISGISGYIFGNLRGYTSIGGYIVHGILSFFVIAPVMAVIGFVLNRRGVIWEGLFGVKFLPESRVKKLAESRILDFGVEGKLNTADYYIFVLNFYELFYDDDVLSLGGVNKRTLDAIRRAITGQWRSVKREGSWRGPLSRVSQGARAGQDVADESIAKRWADKLGGLPEPQEVEKIFSDEYLPRLMEEFDYDVACYLAVILMTTIGEEGIFPYSGDVSEEEVLNIAEEPTQKNVVSYVQKVHKTKTRE